MYNLRRGENMVKVKSAKEIADRYNQSIANVPDRYKKGVQNTTGWKDSALKGQDLYETQMQNRAVLQRRKAGLEKVSEDDWKKNAAEKGATRIGAGMQASAAKREANFEPFRKAIEEINLPARTADPMANIDARVKPIAQKLHDIKMGK
jgi:hypothetical protein